MRAFIAINLSEETKQKIVKLENNFKKHDLSFKWVNPDNLHLTLKFLGNINQEQAEKVKEIITKVSIKFTSFETNLKSFGFFPNKKKPKVFFISLDKEKLLLDIAEKLEKRLETLGFMKENRFKSHITLARIKDLKNIDKLMAELANTQLSGQLFVDSIILYESNLTKEGPIYGKIFKSSMTA
ncbi:MAG: RNA 2',3'-cyclic phosphodiesterase [Candidatus Omnitrophica bacterium]|nr:RNA 2',3'-cyclic phosphodiesterase [Candidatus Omnitrophota bacterium]